jgi:hypothetical protein
VFIAVYHFTAQMYFFIYVLGEVPLQIGESFCEKVRREGW